MPISPSRHLLVVAGLALCTVWASPSKADPMAGPHWSFTMTPLPAADPGDARSRILVGLYGGPARLRDRGNLRYRIEGPWFDQGCGINPCTLVRVDRVHARQVGDGVARGTRVLGRVTRALAPSANDWVLNGRDTLQIGPALMGQGFGLGASYRF